MTTTYDHSTPHLFADEVLPVIGQLREQINKHQAMIELLADKLVAQTDLILHLQSEIHHLKELPHA